MKHQNMFICRCYMSIKVKSLVKNHTYKKNKNIVELIKENKNTVKYIILSPHWQNHN